MDWKKIVPWNWFKEEQAVDSTRAPARSRAADPFEALRLEMERLHEDFFARGMPALPRGKAFPGDALAPLRPSADISEGKKAYTVRVELPGVDLEDVSIETEGRTLVIHAEKRQERDEEEEGYHCVERSYGAVQRVLSLPEDADGDAIDAKFKNGVLKLRIPKHAARAARGRSIDVKSG